MARKFTSIKYDIAFKRVFTKPHIMKAFLNTVLKDVLKAPIVEIEYKPTDFIAEGTKFHTIMGVKHAVIDLFCIDQEGRRLLVELQKGTDLKAIPRFVDYQCRNFSSQFKSGSGYKTIVPCYSICWLFDIQPEHGLLWERIHLCSTASKSFWLVDWQIIALYPQNLNWQQLLEAGTQEELEEWLLLDVVVDIPKANQIYSLLQSQTVSEAFSELDLSFYTDQQLECMEFEHISQQYTYALKEHNKKLLAKAEKEKKKALAKKEKEQAAALAKKEKEQAAALAKKEKEQAAVLAKKEKEQKETLYAIAKSLIGLLDVETISEKTGLSVGEIEGLIKE